MLMKLIFSVCLFYIVTGTAIPNEKRVLEKDFKDHFKDGEHNKQYDHEAFLGEEEAHEFDQLTPEESRRRLGVIVDKIDVNKDGFVDLSELKDWIKYSQLRHIDIDVNRQWKIHNSNNKEKVAWEDYKNNVYGFMDEMDPKDLDDDSNGFTYRAMYARDRRRWSVADKDGDDSLSKEEFKAFLHPEEDPRMKGVVIEETLQDIDKNNDGKISVDEYIGDMYRTDGNEDEEPEWVKKERETFANYRDKNSDGFMDKDELQDWVIPEDFDHAAAEARHLIYEADTDSDEKLTKNEILDQYDLFVGSQATDFGDALTRHDEF